MKATLRQLHNWLVPGVDRFGLVLGVLTVSFLLLALGGSSAPRLVEALFPVLALWLAFRASATSHRVRIGAAVMVFAAFIAVAVISLSFADNTARGVGELWFIIVYILTLVAVLRRVLTHQEVTLETICGALAAYLLLGMMFSSVYGAMAYLGNQPLFVQGVEPSIPLRQYFSFTTLTTLGYGDVTAATDMGRAVAVLESICGQIFLVTLIARLVANFAGRRRPNL